MAETTTSDPDKAQLAALGAHLAAGMQTGTARRSADRGPWRQTFTGVAFYFFDPRPEDVLLDDLAHHLAGIYRFGGATRMTVAQHCYDASLWVPAEHARWALLHDAAEAYLGDFSGPLKAAVPALGVIEERVLCAIAARFDLPWPMPETTATAIKAVDRRLLATEKAQLLGPEPQPWGELPEPYPWKMHAKSSIGAKQCFRHRFEELWAADVQG